MPAIDDCCYRCSACGSLTCYVEYCANFSFYADVVRMLCGDCAQEADQ